jgi:hypothetical protein
MKTTEASKLLSEDDKFMTFHVYNPIYDEKGYFTGFYETDNPCTHTQVKLPPSFLKGLENQPKDTYSLIYLDMSHEKDQGIDP